MSKTKKRWMALEDAPEECKPLLAAYDRIFGLHHINHIVRFMRGGEWPALQVQYYGRLSVDQVNTLQEEAGCLVEIEGRAPGYLLIMIFGGYPKIAFKKNYGGATNPQFLFRPFAR